MCFHFRLFPGKANKIFKKSQKLYFGAILGTFFQNLGNNAELTDGQTDRQQ